MEDHTRADIHTGAHEGSYAITDGYALKEAAASAEPVLKQAPGRTCRPWKEVHTGTGDGNW